MYLPILLIFGAIASIWLLWRYKHRRMIAMARLIPGPPTVPLLGNALRFMGHPEELVNEIKNLLDEYGDVLKFWLGPDLNIVVNNPDDLKLLLSSSKTSVKGPVYKYMADVLGGGILSGSGPTWRKHRKIANPSFGKKTIKSYSDVFNSEADILIQALQKTRGQVNAYDHIVIATTFVTCQTLMGLTREETLNLPYFYEVIEKSPRLYNIVFDRMTKWYLQIDPVFWMTESYRAQRYLTKIVTELSNSIIQHRVKKLNHLNLLNAEQDSVANTKSNVIDRFILSQELNEEELSQEATGKIAAYLILMIAFHPECQEKLYAEIMSVFGGKDRVVTDKDLRRMSYLEMVFKETVRLFPTGAMLQRTVKEDITISSCTIPAGSSFVAPIFQLQRDARFWENPEQFDPERFSAERTKLRNPNNYMPFSVGPMDCLGRHFGSKLVKILCVKVLREFKVSSLQTYKDLKLIIAVSVKSLIGFPVIFEPRK